MDVFLVSLTLGVLLPLIALWPLEHLFPARRDQPLWRTDSRLDVLYWVCLPALRAGLAAAGVVAVLSFGVRTETWLSEGFGPLGRQPVWLQVVGFLVLFDVSSYWVHRWFHGSRLWKFHAIHHSSRQLDWLSTLRHHPVNDVAMRVGQAMPAVLLGFSPQVIAWCLPVLTFHSLLIHANVNWTFGPLGLFIVSPAFHHWHHTSQAEGRDRNFAELCPVWDLLFGTYFAPNGRRPEEFGIDDRSFPDGFLGQLLYPFRRGVGSNDDNPGNGLRGADDSLFNGTATADRPHPDAAAHPE
jgi:sterol desaturase/sphingolipid hydroxylase (fatty acid hydroxylase superfamily)